MRTKDLIRAFKWAENNYLNDELAAYYFRICLVIGNFIEPPEIPYKLKPAEHYLVDMELFNLRDVVAKQVIEKIKGKRI